MLDIDEFKAGYGKYYGIQIDEAALEELFNSVDEDGSGSIEFSEFITMDNELKRAHSRNLMKEMFYIVGRNRDDKRMRAQDIRNILLFALNLDDAKIN